MCFLFCPLLQPLPRPRSFFDPNALNSKLVRWSHHQCGSFACLNARREGQCLQCFNLTHEAQAQAEAQAGARGGRATIHQVLGLKSGSIR